jgi:hypothetical protein
MVGADEVNQRQVVVVGVAGGIELPLGSVFAGAESQKPLWGNQNTDGVVRQAGSDRWRVFDLVTDFG